MIDEIWLPVVGYEESYEVSNSGYVRRSSPSCKAKKGYIIARVLVSNGYLTVNLHKSGKGRNIYIHRLVAMAFLGSPPNEKYQVNHKNMVRTDNHVENLEWVTRSQNQKHAYAHGRTNPVAEKRYTAKLTWDQVNKIRELSSYGVSGYALAKAYHVSTSAIYSIIKYESWKDA